MAVSSATAKLLNLNHRQYLWIYGIAKVVGTDQLCVGQTSASEVRVIHTLDDIFREDSTEGVLLIDASNVFNTLNRKSALANSLNLCPSIAAVLIAGQIHPYSLMDDPSYHRRVQLKVAPLL